MNRQANANNIEEAFRVAVLCCCAHLQQRFVRSALAHARSSSANVHVCKSGHKAIKADPEGQELYSSEAHLQCLTSRLC